MKPILRLFARLALAAALVVPAPLPAQEAKPAAGRKLALLVGIDHYGPKWSKHVTDNNHWSELDGAANDVQALGAELEKRGFEVKLLLDEQATKAGILQAFRSQLVEKSQAGRGDVLFFHYSGHGQQIPDDNGTPDEADGYDEAIVPFDNKGLKNYAGHLRDDDLGSLLQEARKRTDNIVISLDSCHSGTATRGTLKKRGHGPVHAPAKTRGEAKDEATGILPAGGADASGFVFFSAVRADQEANEDSDAATGKTMGAFTYQLVLALRDAGPKTTYQDLLDRIGARIVGRVGNQNPQIEGDAHKVLFSGEWAARPKYHRVRPVNDEGELPIEAGSLHGLQVGSELDVLPLGTSEGKPLARVKISRLELGLSFAVATEGKLDPSKFDKGAQAVEVLSQAAPGRFRVAVAGAADKLQPVVERLKFADVVSGKQALAAVPVWDVRLVEKDGQVRIERADGTTLAIPRGKNLPMDQAIALDDPNLEQRVGQALEAHWRRGKVLELDNHDPSTRLDIQLRVTRVEATLETLPDGRRRPKILATKGEVGKDGNDAVKVGEIVQLHVENKSPRPCFYTVLEVAADGGVSVLFPFAGTAGDNLLQPGEKRAIAMPFRMTPPHGMQVFKVIATEDDIDFRALEYKVRSGKETRGAGSALERLMGLATAGKRAEAFGYEPQKLWGTDMARFEIR